MVSRVIDCSLLDCTRNYREGVLRGAERSRDVHEGKRLIPETASLVGLRNVSGQRWLCKQQTPGKVTEK